MNHGSSIEEFTILKNFIGFVDYFFTAVSIVQTLQRAGYITYFAGGWVRDYIMREPSDDIDIATTASVAEITSFFPKTILVGASFGVVVVVLNGYSFEVATFRTEGEYVDGRRPASIDKATPIEDAQRRDFTINGMFYDPIAKKIFDYVGGQGDIEKKIVRAIGDPLKRFSEDRLRMIRGVRYATRFGFSIEKQTEDSISIQAKDLFPSVSIERVWQEFKKMARFSPLDKNLVLLHRLNLLPEIFPSLRGVSIVEIEKRVQYIPFFPKAAPVIVSILELFPFYSQKEISHLAYYLKLSRKEKEFIEFYIHSKLLLSSPFVTSPQWVDFYSQKESLLVMEIFASHLSDEEKKIFWQNDSDRNQKLGAAVKRKKTKNPVVSSQDLIEAGATPGKNFGKLLQEAEEIAIENGTESKSFIIKMLKKSLIWNKKHL